MVVEYGTLCQRLCHFWGGKRRKQKHILGGGEITKPFYSWSFGICRQWGDVITHEEMSTVSLGYLLLVFPSFPCRKTEPGSQTPISWGVLFGSTLPPWHHTARNLQWRKIHLRPCDLPGWLIFPVWVPVGYCPVIEPYLKSSPGVCLRRKKQYHAGRTQGQP